jgi:ribosomal protein S14
MDRLRAELEHAKWWESLRCSKCGTNLGLLHADACPLCKARAELDRLRAENAVLREKVEQLTARTRCQLCGESLTIRYCDECSGR